MRFRDDSTINGSLVPVNTGHGFKPCMMRWFKKVENIWSINAFPLFSTMFFHTRVESVDEKGQGCPGSHTAFAPVAKLLCGMALLATAGCATTLSPQDVPEKQYSFKFAPDILYLTSFGSTHDVNPPTGFKKWLLGTDIEAENNRVKKPYSIATFKGKVYINDARAFSGYWELDLATKELTLIRNQLIKGSLGIAVDKHNHKYLTVPLLLESKINGTLGTKNEEGRIVVFDDKNEQIQAASFPGRPIEIAVKGKKLFVTDGVNNRVVVMDKTTLKVIGGFGSKGSGASNFIFPKGITVGDDGLVYVGDRYNGRIKVFKQNGDFVSQYGNRTRVLGGFVNLTGIDVDRTGRVYAVDSNSLMKVALDEVQIFDSSKFYFKGEKAPSIEVKAKNRKNALYGYFQKPNAQGKIDRVSDVQNSLYMPVDIAIDYENTEFFKDLVPPDYKLDYLLWMTSQAAHNGKNISVFARIVKNK